MWPFPRRSKPNLPPKPTWLKVLLVAFIGYAVFISSMPSKNNKAHTALQTAKENIQKSELADLGSYKRKLFPEHAAALEIKDEQEGTGTPAVCGQQVEVAYQAYLAQGNELEDRADAKKPLRFHIGDGNAMPVFDRGVIGMKVGGKRSVVAPFLMAYGLEKYRRDDVPQNATTRFELELLSVSPPLPSAEASPFRVADLASGDGPLLVCGEEASLRVTLWNVQGKKLYTSQDPIIFTPGKSEVMIGLEHGVIGMQIGGRRLLIIPPSFQATLNGNIPKITLPLVKNETMLVEVDALLPPNH